MRLGLDLLALAEQGLFSFACCPQMLYSNIQQADPVFRQYGLQQVMMGEYDV